MLSRVARVGRAARTSSFMGGVMRSDSSSECEQPTVLIYIGGLLVVGKSKASAIPNAADISKTSHNGTVLLGVVAPSSFPLVGGPVLLPKLIRIR